MAAEEVMAEEKDVAAAPAAAIAAAAALADFGETARSRRVSLRVMHEHSLEVRIAWVRALHIVTTSEVAPLVHARRLLTRFSSDQ